MGAFDPAAFQGARRGSFGADLRWRSEVGSTQDEAREAAFGGAGEGCVVVAERQSAGRGRWGRTWQSEPGAGLLFTVVLSAHGAASPSSLPVALGVASVRALRGLGLGEAALKWPNDLWWRERKIGGLLVEQARDRWLAGCGINLTQGRADWPDGLKNQAASLRQAGVRVSREALLAAVLAAWEDVLAPWRSDGLGPLLGEIGTYDALQGRDCRVSQGRETIEGRVLGVAPDGTLRMALPDGAERRLSGAQAMDLRPSGAD